MTGNRQFGLFSGCQDAPSKNSGMRHPSAGAIIYGGQYAFTSYAWVPTIAPLCGSVLAVGFFHLISFLYEKDNDDNSPSQISAKKIPQSSLMIHK